MQKALFLIVLISFSSLAGAQGWDDDNEDPEVDPEPYED